MINKEQILIMKASVHLLICLNQLLVEKIQQMTMNKILAIKHMKKFLKNMKNFSLWKRMKIFLVKNSNNLKIEYEDKIK
jgi:hypothetical protein